MKVALIPLALGSLLTWLLAGPFRDLLVRTLPFHFGGASAEAAAGAGVTTGALVVETLTAPSTWIALAVVAAGIALWFARRAFARLRLPFLRRAAEAGYGFETINRQVSRGIQGAGEGLRATQSGFMNWNVAAIVMAVIVVLVVVGIAGWQGG